MPVILSSPGQMGNPSSATLCIWLCKSSFLSLPSAHLLPPLQTLSLYPPQLTAHHQQNQLFLPAVLCRHPLTSWFQEPVFSLRTPSSVRSCQVMGVFLPQPSYHAACSSCSSSFMTAFCPPSFSLRSPNPASPLRVIFQPPVIPSHFLLIWAPGSLSWASTVLCDDSKICRDASSNTLRSLTSPPRIFSSTQPRHYNFFIFSVAHVLHSPHHLLPFWLIPYSSNPSVLLRPMDRWWYNVFCPLGLWYALFPVHPAWIPWSAILMAPLHTISLPFSCISMLTWQRDSSNPAPRLSRPASMQRHVSTEDPSRWRSLNQWRQTSCEPLMLLDNHKTFS